MDQTAATAIQTNWNQADGSGYWCKAQSFTTGDNADGYVLTTLELRIGSPLLGDIRVRIGNDNSGSPPNSASTDTPLAEWSFTGEPIGLKTLSPTGVLDLGSNTTYWVEVCQRTTLKPVVIGATASDAEDAGGESGWSIGDNVYISSEDSTNYSNASTVQNVSVREFVNMQLRVNGYATNAETPPTTNTAPSFCFGQRVAHGGGES